VEQKRANTVIVEMTERPKAKILVNHDDSTFAYWMAAIAAAVIGNVYAHHEIENLLIINRLMSMHI
jgi:hypothetical protein